MDYILMLSIICIIAFVLRICSEIQKSVQVHRRWASLPDDFDTMSGIEFEHYIAGLLRRSGFSWVTVTQASGDFGVDITARQGGKTWAFQCKHYSRNLGVKPIQEVYSGAAKYHADVAVVVTNAHFTNHAVELAKSLNVALWDRDKVIDMAFELSSSLSRKKNSDVFEIRKQPIKTVKPGEYITNCFQENIAKTEPPIQNDKPRDYILMKDSYDRDDLEVSATATECRSTERFGEFMAHIGAGRYAFGKNVPEGIYDLKRISGDGDLRIYYRSENVGSDIIFFSSDDAKEYRGLDSEIVEYFTLDDSLKVEITKSKMLEIE